jgi:zinc transporter 5/7
MTAAAATAGAALISAPAFDWAAAGLYFVGLGLCYPDADTEQAEKVEDFVGLPSGGVGGGSGDAEDLTSGASHAYSYDHYRNAANAFAAEPMYTYWHFLRSTYRHIMEDAESRSIATFLAINLSFMFVEFVYGVWSNSLGLISDAFHMAFDCVALAIGLAAAVISRWPSNRSYTYGYERVQVLSGFVNGIFLVFVAIFVLWESVERVLEPPDVNTDRLLLVSVLGLLVNIIGLYSFSAVHDQAHGHSHDHGHSHGHGHGDDEGGGGSFNLSGVFLHVLADTLGSVGVIISSLLIQFFGWHVADPICSLCIAGLIFLSVVPLVRETIGILLLRTPSDKARSLSDAMSQLLGLPGVAGYSDPLFWLAHGEHVVGSVKVQLDDGATREADVLASASALFRSRGVREMTLQVERRTSSSPYPMRSPPDPAAFQSYQRGAIPLFSPDNPLNPRAGGFSLDSLATLANAVSRSVRAKKKEKL